MSVLVVAEKPAVARDIAAVLGARARGEGHFQGGQWVVTWAIGHLVALAEPHEMSPAWKRWRLEDLPMLPQRWPLVPGARTRDQYDVVRRFLLDPAIRGVVCATDAGREGELIFRYIYEASGSKKPTKRLWISSLTPEAIGRGFQRLAAGNDYDGLADAARARSRADWLVGMNLSRFYSLHHDDHLSVGRVQTPTLAMLVAREKEIRDFVPEDYLGVVATFAPPDADAPKYQGTYIEPGPKKEAKRFPPEGDEAEAIVRRARAGRARVAEVERKTRRMPPPQLYDLTELQRHANRLYGFTAQRTLAIAQKLYEEHKVLSYPRTSSKHLSQTVASELPAIVQAIAEPYRALLAEGTGTRALGPRFVDDAQVTDHHAIIPTGKTPGPLPPDERRVYDLVCRRLLSAWHGDHVYAVTTVITAIEAEEHVDRYLSTGTSVEEQGWKVLDIVTAKDPPPTLPGGLERGMPRRVHDAKSVKKQTRPPPRYTDATLLTMMETAGRLVDEKELSRAMRDCGLGTPATRAAIIETLLTRSYIVRDGKTFAATDKGIALVDAVHPHVKSPAMTGDWEAKLARIERGEHTLAAFMTEIEDFVRTLVDGPAPPRASGGQTAPARIARSGGELTPDLDAARRAAIGSAPARIAASGASAFASEGDLGVDAGTSRTAAPDRSRVRGGSVSGSAPARIAKCDMPLPRVEADLVGRAANELDAPRSRDLSVLLHDVFGFTSFRPYQEAVCRAAAAGKDVLLVMPTGAGKSLCYQLPGLARGGTTLVVSPLIALMEDQVAQLKKRGLVAERIHSGRPRTESRAACQAYLAGELDFLFIAPERLKVPGFPEMLARRKPALIAIDEAHCISQWGHDFRPDYRMLGDRLPLLRPTPVIALTATATPAVQADIARQLRLETQSHFIHGFRRTNIGVEVVQRSPGERADVVQKLLADRARIPAIVYAPTRKEAERYASALGRNHRVAAYHAGLGANVRDAVQSAFLGGKLDVVIATIAFGMGIDKADVRTVIHTALPASLEGYYQEIGRAGRDGKPSRAVLLHSFVDRKTHEFFLERDYPEPDVVARVHAALPVEPAPLAKVARKAKVKMEDCAKAIEKLWVHGGAHVDADESVRRGDGEWRDGYAAQRAHKEEQLERVGRYAETATCRMLQLVRHFGDAHDSGEACGTCDVCDPSSCAALAFRAPSDLEERSANAVLEALRIRDGRGVAQLLREVFADGSLDRRALDDVLAALARASAVSLVRDAFEKDGKTISFDRVWLRNDDGTTAAPLRVLVTPPPKAGKSKRRARKATTARRKRSKRTAATERPSGLESALRAWRTAEARKQRTPPFRVMTDRTLTTIASTRPTSDAQLLAIPGIGDKVLAKYGPALLALVAHDPEG